MREEKDTIYLSVSRRGWPYKDKPKPHPMSEMSDNTRTALEFARELYPGRYIEYAESAYECMDVHELAGTLFLEIRDEPPTDHRDRVKLSSCRLMRDRDLPDYEQRCSALSAENLRLKNKNLEYENMIQQLQSQISTLQEEHTQQQYELTKVQQQLNEMRADYGPNFGN